MNAAVAACSGAAEQHASFGGELVGGNDTDDMDAAAALADADIDGDASGAAGGDGQVCASSPLMSLRCLM